MRILTVIAALVLTMAANFAVWDFLNRPTVVGSPGAGQTDGRWSSVSYAPFREGQSPLTKTYSSTAEIDQDLAFLADKVHGIRTYTSLEGMQAVPALAQKHGLTMTAGAWLGAVLSTNQLEVTALIDAARRYPDTIKRVIVGNEVLLRGDLPPLRLAGYIRQVRRAINQPVSYADVWEFWLRHPEIADDVDFITIHILPYWENQPVSVAKAADHIRAVYQLVQQRFPNKQILIGEVGWPTAGRSREAAVPGIVNRARFFNDFFALAKQQHYDYNMIEAFDQPWKSALEGTVGANWGFFSTDRVSKFSLGQPMEQNPQWRRYAALALVLGLLPALTFLRRRPDFRTMLAYAALSQLIAGLLVHAGALDYAHSYSAATRAWTTFKLVLETGLGLAILGTARRLTARDDSRPPSTIYEALARDGSLAAVGDALHFLLSLTALGLTLLLVIDPRYRDFPIADFLVPTLGLLGFKLMEYWQRGKASWCYGRLFEASAAVPTTPPASRLMRSLGGALTVLIPLSAVGLLIGEGLVNREAATWAIIFVGLSIPYAVALRVGARAGHAEAPRPS